MLFVIQSAACKLEEIICAYWHNHDSYFQHKLASFLYPPHN